MPSGHTSPIPGSAECVESLSRSRTFRSGGTVLGQAVLLPAQAGWAPFASSFPILPTHVSVCRKPRVKPKWGGKLLTHWKNNTTFLLDLFLSLFLVQPHKHVSQCRTGHDDPHGPTTAENLRDEPQPLVHFPSFTQQRQLTQDLLNTTTPSGLRSVLWAACITLLPELPDTTGIF